MSNVRTRSFNIQDRLIGHDFSVFAELYKYGVPLLQSAGYNPIKVKAKLIVPDYSTGILAVERAAPPPNITEFGASFRAFSLEGDAGHVFHAPSTSTAVRKRMQAGVFWLSTGFTLAGDSGVIAANKLTLNGPLAFIHFTIVASTAILHSPLFRIRRAHDTVVTNEVIGVGTGAQTAFSLNAVNDYICPGSVQITFTDGVGARTNRIRDNGKGRLVSTPPELFLEGDDNTNTIDYVTGAVKLNFSSSYVPTATNILMTYEHQNTGNRLDMAQYELEWDIDE